MAAQAATGLVFHHFYRDVAWITSTWLGNDAVTLVVALPLLVLSTARRRNGAIRWLLVWLGLLGYAVYNYAFYLFGAALNVFFPFYVASVVLAGVTLILAVSQLDVSLIAASFAPTTPVRFIGASLVLIGVGLTAVWIGMWAAYVFADRATPVEPEIFKLVAALDLSLMAPALTIGGALLWRRHPWGYAISAIAGMQGSLYLLVLTTNSALAIDRDFAGTPGELPLWGVLTPFMVAVTVRLLACASRNVRTDMIGTTIGDRYSS
jgi:hypothetical protein